MEEKLGKVYAMIQRLEIQPTKHNINLLAACLQLLSEVYAELTKPDGDGGDA